MNYSTLTSLFEDIVTSHTTTLRFFTGMVKEQDTGEDGTYPMVLLMPLVPSIQDIGDQLFQSWGVTYFVLDTLDDDRTAAEVNTSLDTLHTIAVDIFREFWEKKKEVTFNGYTVDMETKNVSIVPLIDDGTAKLTGWEVSFTLQEQNILDVCTLPFNPSNMVLTKAIKFNGIDEYATKLNDKLFNSLFTGAFSVEFYIKRSAINTSQIIFSRQDASGFQFRCQFNTLNQILFISSSDGTSVDLFNKSTSAITDVANYHHIVYASDGCKSHKIIIDGAVDTLATDYDGTITSVPSLQLTLGALYTGGNLFNGNIALLAFYSKELTTAEAVSRYNGGSPQIPTHGALSLFGYYAGNDATFTTTFNIPDGLEDANKDLTGNNMDGTNIVNV